VILTAKAVLDVKPDASDGEIRAALGSVLLRCFTHARMLRAIRSALRSPGNAPGTGSSANIPSTPAS
jgi:aerobic-type carbon monoxide dehydrogenase small subunit (CoxS/CutS family)